MGFSELRYFPAVTDLVSAHKNETVGELYTAAMNPIVFHLGYEEKAFQFAPVCVQHLTQCPWMCWQGK